MARLASWRCVRRRRGELSRRIMDVVIATIGLVVLAPLFLLCAFAICWESGFPLLYSQVRLGEEGRRFRLYKFRKFGQDSGTVGLSVTLENDPRLTRVGKVLAVTKLDELPQLWNVLKGDMSIVGPRPEVPAFEDCYDETYRVVLGFRPGIFGPNQVFFRNEGSLYPRTGDPEEFYRGVLFPLKARADLAYFPYRTLLRDVAWMMRGALAVVGWLPASKQGADLIEHIESWIKQSQDFAGGRDAGA